MVIPTSTHYKIYYCDNCPTLGQRLSSQLRPLDNNPSLTQVLPQSQNQLLAYTAKPLNSQHPKSHHLSSLLKNHKHNKLRNTPTQSLVITTAKFADRPRPTGHSPHFTPQSVIPYLPIKVECKYTRRKHNNNRKIRKLYYHTLVFSLVQHFPIHIKTSSTTRTTA